MIFTSPGLKAAGAKATIGVLARVIPLEEMPDTPEAPFLQQAFWGRYKTAFGWNTYAFRLDWDNGSASPAKSAQSWLLVLERELGAGIHLAYIPHGPSSNSFVSLSGLNPGVILASLAQQIAAQLPHRPVCVRYDLDWELCRHPSVGRLTDGETQTPGVASSRNPRDDFSLAPLHKAPSDVQPPDTVLIDLGSGLDAVLAGMKPKTRYNVRLAEKKGVQVTVADHSLLGEWYGMYRETAERDQIAVHSQQYYQTLLAQNPEKLELLLASHEGEVLAGIIVLYTGSRATYLYGASTNHKRNLMPAYLLQWVAMQRAVDRKCTSYDCFGIPPSADPGHPMHGLHQFKTGFGGDIVAYPGCWDSPIKPIVYSLFATAEKLRHLWYKRVKKR